MTHRIKLMAGSKKFGTFGGVFTPSILTILGVIMYMRLGWVVGNAGLWGTIIVILIAHVISVTTGLSISSIATDKKVGAGGVYYVLSRSLGLPIGGAIGLTLFVGTALSISLYLIGFAESFNAFLGFDTSINSLRLSGTLAVLALTSVALISTAVAIKAQYFILGTIALSLVSIVFGSTESTPQSIPFFGGEGSVSLEVVFAIFFPAVTGFTAGIAMSGDLKDPKKSIPTGTIAAIVVGFVVYIALAVFIAYNIDGSALRGDYNILMKFAVFAPAVVAGVWGATLSSALGGILGGPRILQAMSVDKITPYIFSKGKGKDNEPWNALFLTVIIAECGVLIGELDIIARIVSMFYLAAYGFINLSFFLESWASSDFSPSFKVKRWLGLVGFIATFVVMFKLDMLAMFAAFIIIGGIYLWLQRKQITLGTGDIWQSVWSSVVKTGLHKMENTEDHKRNWKPNILLFSGGSEQRPYLIEIAKSVAGKAGMITNFDLIENHQAKVLFPKHKQAVQDEELKKHGIFGRQIEVQNVFKGIESIASTFGFSGIEPNTVLMGWAKNTKDPLWFANMTQKLINLDYNVLYLDYDPRYGFRKYRRIDIWWRDITNSSELTLNIARFLLSSDEWREAEVRILLMNNTLQEGFERKIHQKLDEFRISATVKVFNNAIEQKPFYSLMKSASADTDLIIAGIPEMPAGHEVEFVSTTNELFSIVGTTLLVKSSSKLEQQQLSDAQKLGIKSLKLIQMDKLKVEYKVPMHEQLAFSIKGIESKLSGMSTELVNQYLSAYRNNYSTLIQKCQHELLSIKSELSIDYHEDKLNKIRKETLKKVYTNFKNFFNEDLPYIAERLDDFTLAFTERINQLVNDQPEIVERVLTSNELVVDKNDSFEIKQLKNSKKIKNSFGIVPKLKVPFREITMYHLNNTAYANLFKFQNKFGVLTFTLEQEFRTQLLEIFSFIDALAFSNFDYEGELNKRFIALNKLVDDQLNFIYNYLDQALRHSLKLIANDSSSLLAEDIGKSFANKYNTQNSAKLSVVGYGDFWCRNNRSIVQQTALDIALHNVSYSVKRIAETLMAEIKKSMFDRSKAYLNEAKNQIRKLEELVEKGLISDLQEVVLDFNDNLAYDEMVINESLNGLQQLGANLPDQIEAIDESSKNNFSVEQRENVKLLNIDVSHIADYIIDTHIQRPIENQLQQVPQICRQILAQAIHSLRLVSFSVNSLADDNLKVAELKSVLVKVNKSFSNGFAELDIRERRTIEELEDLFLTALSNLNASHLIEQAEQIKGISGKELNTEGVSNWWQQLKEKTASEVEKYSDIIVARKDSLMYADFNNRNKQTLNTNAVLKTFVEQVSPKGNISSELPFYYQQLFVGKHAPKLEFLQHREYELNESQIAINRIKNGVKGGILVLGESLSGRTFFSEIVAKEQGQGARTYKIDPPITGSNRAKDLLRLLGKQIGVSNSNEEVINEAPEGSIFIFNDLELWWERSANGDQAIKQVIRLIEQYSDRYVFIVNCNIYSYKLIRKIAHFDNYFVSTIQLTPFGVKALKETIMIRHRVGGIKIQYNQQFDDKLVDSKWNKIIDGYLNVSGGNIGSALHQWISNIQQYEDGYIEINAPRYSELPLFDDPDLMVFLAQFILHKHLTLNRIKRIFANDTKEDALLRVNSLQRVGIIEEIMGSTYRISPYLNAFVVRKLKDFELL